MVNFFNTVRNSKSWRKVDPFKNNFAETDVRGIVVLIIGLVVAALLTGAIMPVPVGQMVNATAWNVANSVALLNTSTTPSAVVNAWNVNPIMWTVAAFIVPIIAIVKYMDI